MNRLDPSDRSSQSEQAAAPAAAAAGDSVRNTRIRDRKLVPLAEFLDKRWLAYALAAGAGVLGANQTARAGIIYTPTDLSFTGGTLFIDLNHDGMNDFKFTIGYRYGALRLAVNGNGNLGAAVIGQHGSASALASGVAIGKGGKFSKVQSASQLMVSAFLNSSTSSSFRGKWGNVSDKFLGLRFLINAQPHFGWAEFNVSASAFTVDATLLGYAYNSVPSQKILAGQTSAGQLLSLDETGAGTAPTTTPEPATLGLLALGSLGLAAWRRRRREPLA